MSSNVSMMRAAVATVLALICPLSFAACSSSKGSNETSNKSVIPSSCPSPASIASAAGTAFGAPRVTRNGVGLGCLYQRGGTELAFGIAMSGESVGQFRSSEKAAASASHLTNALPVGGYGSAAYLVATPGDNSVTYFYVLTPGDLVSVDGTLTVAQTEAVARYVLTHVLGESGT